MVLRPTLTGLTLLALLAGCSSAPTDSTQCNVEHLQKMRGKQIDGNLVDELQQDANASTVRVLAPGDRSTRDFNPQRLNIDIDENEVIVRLSCG
ncbi:I78 family peptidase inhibitor [Ectopseudomonas mendocina]|uniref:I78 family peptidase inhibitor n=1 Tax=Ectopseudomonas mendocina TaxID=300 RepID=A0ABZ2RCE6_ECTME